MTTALAARCTASCNVLVASNVARDLSDSWFAPPHTQITQSYCSLMPTKYESRHSTNCDQFMRLASRRSALGRKPSEPARSQAGRLRFAEQAIAADEVLLHCGRRGEPGPGLWAPQHRGVSAGAGQLEGLAQQAGLRWQRDLAQGGSVICPAIDCH